MVKSKRVRRTVQKIGDDWEKEVKEFFSRLGFSVDGGSKFRPGGNQMDFVAGKHNILFIGECKTKQEIGRRGDLKREIEKFRKNSISAIYDFQNGYRGNKFKHYSKFELIFVTKDIVWTEDEERALTSPLKLDKKDCPKPLNSDKVHYSIRSGRTLSSKKFDSEVINYYLSLEKELSADIARFHILADYNLKFPDTESVEIPAIKSVVKGITSYNFVIAPQKILKNVYVARRESKNKSHYQRMIKGKRCEDIINYLDMGTETYKSELKPLFPEGPIIPGNIILASSIKETELLENELTIENGYFNFPENVSLVNLKFPNKYGCLEIVDGQHRLYSYTKFPTNNPIRKMNKNDRVLITLLHNSERAQHRRIFIDLNDKQKGIDKNYIIDMIGEDSPNSIDGRISNVIKNIDYKPKVKGITNYLCNNIKIPSHGTTKRSFSMKGMYQAILKRKLVQKKLEFEQIINPFYINIKDPQKDTREVNTLVIRLARELAYFISLSREILGEDLRTEENPAKYSLSTLLEGRGKDGLIDVLIGFYSRILAAKNKNSNKLIIPEEEDIRNYLEPIAEHFKELRNREDLDAFISTAGQGPRDNTIRRWCSLVVSSGFKEFEFEDLDITFNEILERSSFLEKKLRKLINFKLSLLNPDWCKRQSSATINKKEVGLLSGGMFNKLKKKAGDSLQQNNRYIEDGQLYLKLGFGEIKDLIINLWDKAAFDAIFVEGGNKFRNLRQFEEAIEHLTRYRNKTAHKGSLTPEEEKTLKKPSQQSIAIAYLNTFEVSLENFKFDLDERVGINTSLNE